MPYPTGRFFRGTLPRHFVPGYDHPVPLGRNTFSAPRLRLSQRLWGFNPGDHPINRFALKGREMIAGWTCVLTVFGLAPGARCGLSSVPQG